MSSRLIIATFPLKKIALFLFSVPCRRMTDSDSGNGAGRKKPATTDYQTKKAPPLLFFHSRD